MGEQKITSRRRIARATRTKASVKPAAGKPILHVFRSSNHIYAQIIDHTGKVLAAASDIKLKDKKAGVERAVVVGGEIAKLATANKVKVVAFSRRNYKYHGRVKALADAAREAGLVF